MNIINLTIDQARKIAAVFANFNPSGFGLSGMVGKKCIVRTYAAGVWFGEIAEKDGNEVIVKDARRLWSWKAAESISLSAVAVYGIVQSESRIAPSVPKVWLEAIELIPASTKAVESIEGAEDAVAR